MALFTRNVTGDDVLALWVHIAEHGPIERHTLLKRFYPDDASDPDQSDRRKPLEDAIEVLVESDQILNGEDGYTIAESYTAIGNPRVALLKGFRGQEGEDAAYMDVLDLLTREDRRYFSRSGPLVDLMSGYRSEVSWNESRLRYWARMMNAIGVIAPVNTDADEEHTDMLLISQALLRELLGEILAANKPKELDSVLRRLDEEYLPVFATTNRDAVATFVQRSLAEANRQDLIELQQKSDFGSTHSIQGAGYNMITLRVGDV